MTNAETVLESVRAALRGEPRIDVHRFPLHLALAEGVLTIEGEAENIAAKKLALERAASMPGVDGIVDRLRVRPAQPMGDGQIRDHVRDALLAEPAFAGFAIFEEVKGERRVAAEPAGRPRGTLIVAVEDGVVTLNGEVPGLDYKRLAGVLAWWVPGSRDVVNRLAVEPDEPDSFDAIAEAVRLALEKDPLIDAGQMRIGVRGTTVTLFGVLPSEAQREMAESDAWYVFGVDRVVNRIEVRR